MALQRRPHPSRWPRAALGADEEHVLAAQNDFAYELLRQLELTERLLEVDDVDPVALGENEAAHLGIPSASLVSEVDTGLEELLETWLHLRFRTSLGLVVRFRQRRRRLAGQNPR
jgi:hypothetical protein